VEMRRVVFRQADSAAGADDAYVARAEDAVRAGAFPVGKGAPEGDGNDLHVLVRLTVVAVARFDDVVVEDPQRTELHFCPVIPVAETERVVTVQPAKIDMAALRGRMKNISHRISICRWILETREQTLMRRVIARQPVVGAAFLRRIIRSVRVKFDDEIIAAFARQDRHVILLYQLQQGEEQEDRMQPAFTDLEHFLERQGPLTLHHAKDMGAAFFHRVIIPDYGMDGFVLPLLDAEHQPLEGLHQLEQRDGLDLRAFSRVLADPGKLLLQVAAAHHEMPDSFHFCKRRGRFLIPFVFQQFVYQLLPRVDLVPLRVQLLAREEHPGLDPHERRDEENEFAGELDIEVLLGVDVPKKIGDDPVYGDIVDVQLAPFDKEQQQVERAFELG